jgi:hypothetical protein
MVNGGRRWVLPATTTTGFDALVRLRAFCCTPLQLYVTLLLYTADLLDSSEQLWMQGGIFGVRTRSGRFGAWTSAGFDYVLVLLGSTPAVASLSDAVIFFLFAYHFATHYTPHSQRRLLDVQVFWPGWTLT